MKKLFQIIAFAGFILVSYSCKKEKDPVANDGVYSYSSNFSVTQNYDVVNNLLVLNGRKPNVSLSKWYSKSKGPSPLHIDSLYFNDTPLKFGYNYYTISNTDTLPQNNLSNFKWRIVGSLEFPSFTETMPDSLPRFTKFNMLPDSISINGTTVIQLGGANANEINILIADGINSYGWGATLPATTGSFSITNPSMVAATTNGTLTVTYLAKYSKTIDGKNINFTKSSTYKKQIKITN